MQKRQTRLLVDVAVTGLLALGLLEYRRAKQRIRTDEDEFFADVKQFVKDSGYNNWIPRPQREHLYTAVRKQDINRCAQALLETLPYCEEQALKRVWPLYGRAAMLQGFQDTSSEALPPRIWQ